MQRRIALTLLLFGCGSDPLPFPDLDASITSDTGGMSCADEEVVRAMVFEPSCAQSQCHDSFDPKAEIDLITPGIEDRMRAHISVHMDCRDRPFLSPGNAAESFFLAKLLGGPAICGDPMPNLGEIDAEQRRCVAEWIQAMEP